MTFDVDAAPGRPAAGRAWCQALSPLATAAVLVSAGLAGCGDRDQEASSGAPSSEVASQRASSEDSATATPAPGPRTRVVIRTAFIGFEGHVLRGSVWGDVPFCVGGRVRHEPGSPDIGYPAINVLDCPEGSLQIGFGPGPDQMDQAVQTSGWELLEGTGSFAGAQGAGRMRVRFERAGGSTGRETFHGYLSPARP